MGTTEIIIAAWQQANGITPASGQKAELLHRMSGLAFELIKIIELESSGIRDGDGHWHGSDAMGGRAHELGCIIAEYLRVAT
jgi:hypothetical protein